MKAALILLLLAPATRVELVDEIVVIPPSDWRYVEVLLKQTPVVVNCSFETQGAGVRVALVTRADFDRLRAGRSHGAVAQTPVQPSGALHVVVRAPGEYELIADNRGQPAPVTVRLRASLDFAGGPELGVRYLSPERRLVVIIISFAVFFGIVTWSARKLLRAIRM